MNILNFVNMFYNSIKSITNMFMFPWFIVMIICKIKILLINSLMNISKLINMF